MKTRCMILKMILTLTFIFLSSGVYAEPKNTYKVQVVFTSQCPCVQRMMKHIKSLVEENHNQGFVFEFYDVGSKDQKTSDAYARLQKFPTSITNDHDLKIAKKLGAEISPTAFVWDEKGKLQYKGAIIIENFEDSAQSKKPLEEALQSLKKGQPVKNALTTPEGCFIVSDIQ